MNLSVTKPILVVFLVGIYLFSLLAITVEQAGSRSLERKSSSEPNGVRNFRWWSFQNC